MRLRMIREVIGSPDGIEVRRYEAGRVYEIPAPLAQALLASGRAEEDKAIDRVPETKEIPKRGRK